MFFTRDLGVKAKLLVTTKLNKNAFKFNRVRKISMLIPNLNSFLNCIGKKYMESEFL